MPLIKKRERVEVQKRITNTALKQECLVHDPVKPTAILDSFIKKKERGKAQAKMENETV